MKPNKQSMCIYIVEGWTNKYIIKFTNHVFRLKLLIDNMIPEEQRSGRIYVSTITNEEKKFNLGFNQWI